MSHHLAHYQAEYDRWEGRGDAARPLWAAPPTARCSPLAARHALRSPAAPSLG